MTTPEQRLAEVEEFLDVWDAAPAHRARYRDVISSQKSGEDGRKLRATALRELVAEVQRLRALLDATNAALDTANRRFQAAEGALSQAQASPVTWTAPDDRRLAEIRSRDALKGGGAAGATMTQADADRRTLLRLLAEMTLCRDNAVRHAEREDVEIEFHLDEQLRDGLAGVAEWLDSPEPDHAPDWLIDAVVRVVRPELARLTEQRDAFAGALNAATSQFGLTFQQLADADEDKPTPELIEAGRKVRGQICDWLAEYDTEPPPDWHHCAMCGERCYWQESPHGGWWVHEAHPAEGREHDAVAGAPCRPGVDDYCEPPSERTPALHATNEGGEL